MKHLLILLACFGLMLQVSAQQASEVKGTPRVKKQSKAKAVELPSMASLCDRYRTDKCDHWHNFIEVYSRVFAPYRSSATKVFEIGILNGASHRMWKAYFDRAEVYGMDIKDCSYLEDEGIHTFIADQANREMLQDFIDKYEGGYDIILDDGGHYMNHQQVSFGFLFEHLKPGGIYVLEDVHTSLPEFYPNFGVNEKGTNSTLHMINTFMEKTYIKSEFMTQEEKKYLENNIDYMEMSYRTTPYHSMVCIIKKKGRTAAE